MFALALEGGYGENTWVHGVGDGAPWIAQQMAEVFPQHRYLLDRYHLLEHLYKGATGLPSDYPVWGKQWVEQQIVLIDGGKVAEVMSQCNALSEGNIEQPLGELSRYLTNQQGHLDYDSAREQGLPIGSGAVEGGHRHVIQARLKLPGTWWNEKTLNPMLALRTLRANGRWEAFWN